MWLTSNRPAPVRTAMCSAVMPLYSSGMSQPPKGTIFAPDARWRALSGVFLSGGDFDTQRYYARSKRVNLPARPGDRRVGSVGVPFTLNLLTNTLTLLLP